MKKLVLLCSSALFLSFAAHAQTSYGIKAGMNLAKLSNVDNSLEDYQKNNLSFYLTGFADIPVASQFSIQPGISLQGKGEKYSVDETIANAKVDGSARLNILSIEIPVNAVYWIPAGPGKVYVGAGPYIGFNIDAKLKTDGDVTLEIIGDGDKDELDLEIGKDKDIHVVDAGMNFLAGYKLNNGFLINAGYGLGFTKILTDGDKRSSRVFNLGIGYQF
ncbi:porin family protein [Sphingobacterium lactis]|uniref:porin family protein n=1 Tax=Sphingobacterium lactis TaxID=797291 RepID=UPI003EC67DE2